MYNAVTITEWRNGLLEVSRLHFFEKVKFFPRGHTWVRHDRFQVMEVSNFCSSALAIIYFRRIFERSHSMIHPIAHRCQGVSVSCEVNLFKLVCCLTIKFVQSIFLTKHASNLRNHPRYIPVFLQEGCMWNKELSSLDQSVCQKVCFQIRGCICRDPGSTGQATLWGGT